MSDNNASQQHGITDGLSSATIESFSPSEASTTNGLYSAAYNTPVAPRASAAATTAGPAAAEVIPLESLDGKTHHHSKTADATVLQVAAPLAGGDDNKSHHFNVRDVFHIDEEHRRSLDDAVLPVPDQKYNTPFEVERIIANLAVKKTHLDWHRSVYLGFLAGVFVGLPGILAMTVSGGLSADLRTQQPMLPKLLIGVTFPMALFLIILFGGELFTGNVMVLIVAVMQGKISMRQLATNWVLVFLSNFAGCVLTAYLFGYAANLFSTEPYLSQIVSTAEHKCVLPFHVAFLRGIPANALVCLAVFQGLTAREVSGKILGMFFPVFCFAVIGYEHCVANMFYISLGMFYGANCSVVQFIFYNVLPVALGNIVGGGFLVGASEVYLYHWGIHGHSHKRSTKRSRFSRSIKSLTSESH